MKTSLLRTLAALGRGAALGPALRDHNSISTRFHIAGFIRLTLFALGITASSSAQVNVLTANYDSQRTNANPRETTLHPSNVNTTSFGRLGAFPVDGQIYAQPLYAAGVEITGNGAHNVVYVVTMHNSVYAIDADAPQSTVPLWRVNLGPSVPSSALNFTDILPEVGILSTPVIDPARQVMYLVADTLQDGVPGFNIHALSLADGRETMHGPAVIAAAVRGDGPGSSDDGALRFDALQSLQRPGLALTNGTVYLGFGSHADGGNFHGWLIGYDASDLVMLKTKEAQIQQLEANKAALDRKLNVIKDLERIRLLYPKFLTDLNLQLTKNIWLTSVVTSTKADGLDLTISAKALDAYSIADQISRMEASGRFKNIEIGPIGTAMQEKQKVLTFTLTCRHLL